MAAPPKQLLANVTEAYKSFLEEPTGLHRDMLEGAMVAIRCGVEAVEVEGPADLLDRPEWAALFLLTQIKEPFLPLPDNQPSPHLRACLDTAIAVGLPSSFPAFALPVPAGSIAGGSEQNSAATLPQALPDQTQAAATQPQAAPNSSGTAATQPKSTVAASQAAGAQLQASHGQPQAAENLMSQLRKVRLQMLSQQTRPDALTDAFTPAPCADDTDPQCRRSTNPFSGDAFAWFWLCTLCVASPHSG